MQQGDDGLLASAPTAPEVAVTQWGLRGCNVAMGAVGGGRRAGIYESGRGGQGLREGGELFFSSTKHNRVSVQTNA
jgi:hypothetical protein